jgi:hypothetical protein
MGDAPIGQKMRGGVFSRAIMGIRNLLFGIIASLTVNVSFAQNSIEVGGFEDIEVENFSSQAIPGDYSWMLTNSFGGFSSTGEVEAAHTTAPRIAMRTGEGVCRNSITASNSL